MLCPHCKIDLQTVNLKGTNIDICPTCYGIFLDKDELKKILEINRDSLRFIDIKQEMSRDSLIFIETGRNMKSEINGNLSKLVEINSKEKTKDNKLWEKEIECPKCKKLMQKFPYAGSSDIIIDSCRDGCGIWLDKGEIFKIADYLTTAKQPLDTKQQQNIRQILETMNKDKKLNIWELLGKRYDISEKSQMDMMSDLESSNEGKYVALILTALQGIIYFLLRKL